MHFNYLLRTRVPSWTLLAPILALLLLLLAEAIAWLATQTFGLLENAGFVRNFPWAPVGVTILAALCICGILYVFQTIRPAMSSARNPSRPLSSEDVAKAGSLLDLEAAKVAGLMASSVDAHESYAGSLEAVLDKIAAIETPDQLRAIAGHLASENLRVMRGAQAMARKLDESRSQIDNLRSSLLQARQENLLDPLTGIRNRRAFEDALPQAVRAAASANTSVSIVMIDIDRFKTINDSYGHLAGDQLLKAFAQLLADRARKDDTVVRFGGEEFALILPRTSLMAASVFAERLRNSIAAQEFDLGSAGQVQITASLGVAELEAGENADAMLRRADNRLYRAKNLGRNRVVTT